MTTEFWLAISAGATFILALAAFGAIWQNHRIQVKEYRYRLINEIIEWAEDILKCHLELPTSPIVTEAKDPKILIELAMFDLRTRYRYIDARHRYVRGIAPTFGIDLGLAVDKVIKELKSQGISIMGKPKTKVQNIVASASLGGIIDLEESTYKLTKTMYEPEQFPGMIHRMDSPKVVILIFASGKLVVTGAKKEEDVYQAVDILHKKLEKEKIISYD